MPKPLKKPGKPAGKAPTPPKPITPARKPPTPLKAPTKALAPAQAPAKPPQADPAVILADLAEATGMLPEQVATLPHLLGRRQIGYPVPAPLVHRAATIYRQRAEEWRQKWLAANGDPSNRIKVIIDGDPRFDRWNPAATNGRKEQSCPVVSTAATTTTAKTGGLAVIPGMVANGVSAKPTSPPRKPSSNGVTTKPSPKPLKKLPLPPPVAMAPPKPKPMF